HRSTSPEATGRIRVQVAANETEFRDAPAQLVYRSGEVTIRRLRQLRDTREVVREQCRDAVDEVVRSASPILGGTRVRDVMFHRRGLGGEDHEVLAALA